MTVRITKCPPGVALGAGDLHRWASRRLGGKGGMPMTKLERQAAEKRKPKDRADRWLEAVERRYPQPKLKPTK
jgi:hypothetical protein